MTVARSSEHKRLVVSHRGKDIPITYWIDYRKGEKIVMWSISGGRTSEKSSEFVKEPLGGRRGIFGIGGRPERSFHELIASAVEEACQWINENSDKFQPPDPAEITDTLEIRGYEAAPRRY